jgi:replicative DNA helicase
MSAAQLGNRVLASETNLSASALARGRITELDMKRLMDAAARSSATPLRMIVSQKDERFETFAEIATFQLTSGRCGGGP